MRTRLSKNLIFLGVAAGLLFGMVRFAYHKPEVRLKPGVTDPLPPSPPVEPGRSGMPPCWLSTPALSGDQPVVRSKVADCLVLIPGEDKLDVLEVNLFTGMFRHVSTDVFLPAQPVIAFTRVTRPLDDWAKRWRIFFLHLYQIAPAGDRHPYTYLRLLTPNNFYRFERISLGTGYADALYRHEEFRSVLYGSTISWNGNGWTLRLVNGSELVFPEAYHAKRPGQSSTVGLRDPSGNLLRLLRDREGNLFKVVSQDGQWLDLHREGGHISAIEDSRGGSVQYSYDSLDRLRSVVMRDGTALSYSYDDWNRIIAAHKGDRLFFRNEYDGAGQIVKQTFADGQSHCFIYSLDSEGNPQETKIIGPHGGAIKVRFHNRTYEIDESSISNGCK